MNDEKTLFIDMDGTIARFYDSPNCLKQMYEKGYFEHLKAYDQMVIAVRQIITNTNIRVIFHSAYPQENRYADKEKLKWLAKMFTEGKYETVMVAIPADKVKAAEEHLGRKLTKSDFLIDDYTHNLRTWEHGGGSGIKCVNEIQNKADFSSYNGPRIRPTDNAQFLYNTLTRLILGNDAHPAPAMIVTYQNRATPNNTLIKLRTYGPIEYENGQISIPDADNKNIKTYIPTHMLLNIKIE